MNHDSQTAKKPIRGAAVRLALLCMGFYAVSYLCRKSFDSNINEISAYYGEGTAAVGLIGTFFFIAYALGQVIHGVLCKYYSPCPVLFGMGLAVAGLNLCMGLVPTEMFSLMKFIWMANGFACASFWSLLIMTLNRSVSEDHKSAVMLIASFPVAVGTLFSYGISALLSFLGRFRFSFFIAALIMTSAAVYWFVRSPKLIDACLAEKKEKDGGFSIPTPNQPTEKKKLSRSFLILFGTLAFFSIINNLIRDGLSTWTPTILTDTFGMANWLAVLLSVLVPTVSLLGGILALALYKKTKNFCLICSILFGATGMILTVMMGLFVFNSRVITIISLMTASLLMSSANNLLTSLFPLNVEKGINAGTVAGLIDGFCYIGSAASAYGIGRMAETQGGFTGVFRMMSLLAFFCAVVGLFACFRSVKRKEESHA